MDSPYQTKKNREAIKRAAEERRRHVGESEQEANLADLYPSADIDARDVEANEESALTMFALFLIFMLLLVVVSFVSVVGTFDEHGQRLDRLERHIEYVRLSTPH